MRAAASSHIALLVGSLRGGGTERICVTLANELANRGYRIDLVVLNLRSAKYERDVGANVRLVNLQVSAVRFGFWRLRRYLRQARPHVVITFAPQLAVAVILLRLSGLPQFGLLARTGTILTSKREQARDFWNRYVSPTLTKWLYSRADLIVAQSHGMARDLIWNYKVPDEKVVTIPNPVTPLLHLNSDPCVDQGARHDVLFVGRLDPPKDPLFLLRAFNECKKLRPSLRLDIVGTGTMQREVEETVVALGMADSVTLHGFRTDIHKFYARSAVTVLCSRYEGLPNCLIESISLGTPVVSLDCDHGPRDIVIDGVNGYLVPDRDEVAFARAIVRAVDRDWDPSGLRASAQRYQTYEIVDRYEEAIRVVLTRRAN